MGTVCSRVLCNSLPKHISQWPGWKGVPEISPWWAQCNATLDGTVCHICHRANIENMGSAVYWDRRTTKCIHSCGSESFGLEMPDRFGPRKEEV